MEEEIIISPIFYMGSKRKLINKGLIDLFPKDINMFVDLFAGSGIVSMNVDANKYVVNDFNNNLISLIRYFKDNKSDNIINHVNKSILKYELPTFSTDTRKYSGDREIFKIRYNKLRKDYNKSRDIKLLYVLNLFSNSHMIRFNSNNEFNMPFGNGYFTEECKENIINNNYKKINYLTNKDFREIKLNKLSSQDFVYLDPPYFNTTATYNENGGWSENDENDLYHLCEHLSMNNIKFAMSNVFENKGVINHKFIDWVHKNNYNVFTFDKFTYYACGKGNSNTKEVLITNYEM